VVRKRAKYGLHALRHFCASLWIEANYSAKRVQSYMGHASIVQTYDTYRYLFDLRDNDKEALKRVEVRVMAEWKPMKKRGPPILWGKTNCTEIE
jgi:integrase